MKNILKRVNALIKENRDNQNKIYLQNLELEWAAIYHDSIRGKKWLQDLPLNIGRWAGNYSFFYVLNRILMDFKPKSILELGLGESTKFVSTYLDNFLTNSKHLVIEQDENWKNLFVENFTLSQNSKIRLCTTGKIEVKGFETKVYKGLGNIITDDFDLYIIDGPNGTIHYSRYDTVYLAEKIRPNHQFIFIIDDYDREGEKETVRDLLHLFAQKKIKIFKNIYTGNKSVMVIASEKYKFSINF